MADRSQGIVDEQKQHETAHDSGGPAPAPRETMGDAADSAIRRIAKRGLAVARALELVIGGERDANAITDQVLWTVHPELKVGEKVAAGSPEAREWIQLRDEVVRPALASVPKQSAQTQAAQGPEMKTPAAPAPETKTPAASAPETKTPAAPASASEVAGPAHGGGDKYLTQNDNTYNDDAAHKQWGEYGALLGTCNMTSLAMALLSLCGGDEARVRAAAVANLKRTSLRPGAHVKIGGHDIALGKVLADASLADQAQLPDLLAAIGIHKYGYIRALTNNTYIAEIAQELGLAHGVKHDGQSLATQKGREMAKEKLAKGERMVIATPGHLIYLEDVLEDGIVVHDPCGARLSPDAHKPHFMYSGPVAQHALHAWLAALESPALAEVARRRASKNSEALAMIERLLALKSMHGKERTEEEQRIKAMGGSIAMGAYNFYGAADSADWDLSIRVDLEGTSQPNS